MKMKTCRILLLLIAAGLSLYAQNRAEFPWWNSPVVADIGLSQEQTAKIRQVVRSYRNRLLDARNNVQKAEGDLEDVMNDDHINPEAVKPVIDRLANARAASTRVVLEMDIELRSVLTFDQWRLLVKRWDEVKEKKTNSLALPPE
jgi:Spy/CpxP family protein refolding chaperone